MTLETVSSLMSSVVWSAAGLAMVDFLIAGGVAWVIAAGLRGAVRSADPTWRYATACLTLAILVGIAAGAVIRRWPDFPQANASTVAANRPVTTATPASELSIATQAVTVNPPVVAAPTVSLELWQQRLVHWLPWLWIAGVPWVSLFVAVGWVGAARLRGGAEPLHDNGLRQLFERCASAMRIPGVSIAVCDRLTSPIVVGILRPIVLIPPSLLTSLTLEQWEMIMLHELAHIRRLDNLVNLVQRGVETLLFFHPAIWWASRWVRLEREHCCDAVVLRGGATAQAYAETLAVLALPGLSPQLATAAMSNHELLTRMRHILGTEDLAMALTRRKLATAVVLCATVGLLMAAGVQGLGGRASADDDPTIRSALSVLLQERDLAREAQAAESVKAQELIERLERLLQEREQTRTEEVLKALQTIKETLAEKDTQENRNAAVAVSRAIEFLTREGPKGGVDDHDVWTRLSLAQNPAVFHGVVAMEPSVVKRSWSPQQATGAPDVLTPGDNGNAWAAHRADVGAEWLRVGFDEPVSAVAVVIHESFNPGALSAVDVGLASESGGEPETEAVWSSGTAEVPGDKDRRVTVFPLKPGARKVANVTVHVYEPKVTGWNEIDAVGVVDAVTGEVKWGTTAEASSSYGAEKPLGLAVRFDAVSQRSFSATQATGAPNVREPGDSPQAWASATPDGQDEWLELTYDPPVPASALLVYETCNPGALTKVTIETRDGTASTTSSSISTVPVAADISFPITAVLPSNSTGAGDSSQSVISFSIGTVTAPIWEGTDPVQGTSQSGVAVISIPAGTPPIRKVKLFLKSAGVAGFNEIDAVGLLRTTDGQMQWASDATASSEYGVRRTEVRPMELVGVRQSVVGVHDVKGTSSAEEHARIIADYKRLVALIEQNQCSRCHEPLSEESRSPLGRRSPHGSMGSESDVVTGWLLQHLGGPHHPLAEPIVPADSSPPTKADEPKADSDPGSQPARY